jgi:hypothetical protein
MTLKWELGGLEFGGSDGHGFLVAPARVELDKTMEQLAWSMNIAKKHCRSVAASSTVFTDFLELTDATPQVIRDFARQWGVLKLCKHGLPATHSHSPNGSVYFGEDPSYVLESYPYCRPFGSKPLDDNSGFEPVAGWIYFAKMAKALVNIVAKLNTDELGDSSDWATIYERVRVQKPGRDIIQQRMDCVSVVNTWLRVADVKPQLTFDWNPFNHEWKDLKSGHNVRLREGTYIRFESDRLRGSPLFAHLACQLMTIVLGHGIAVCSNCGSVYSPPNRKPKAGQNNYCPRCGLKAARRDAARRYRSRRRNND